ncbi:MAG TPA: hypothetical protein VJ797_08930 [Burkholderiales bacterium]|nr:hypothetical protein [Burkholderiales bacterium]
MRKRAPSFTEINRRLERAVKELSEATHVIKAVKLGPGRNIYRIGQALSAIFDIQADIYRNQPELLPRLLYDTALGAEVLAKSAVGQDGRRKRPCASQRKR